MRDIDKDTLQILKITQGLEPINIIEVTWLTSGASLMYSDVELEGMSGVILNISDLDSVFKIDSSGSTSSITITLDDTDGSLKQMIDSVDIHKRPVTIYQGFKGRSLDAKFVILKGMINTPIVWKEGDRTLTFDVISRMEDKEVGFSPEESSIPNIPPEAIGQAWPLAFGVTQNFPAITYQKVPLATTIDAWYIFYWQDGNEGQAEFINAAYEYNNGMSMFMEGVYAALAAAMIRTNIKSAQDRDNFGFPGAPVPNPFDSSGTGMGITPSSAGVFENFGNGAYDNYSSDSDIGGKSTNEATSGSSGPYNTDLTFTSNTVLATPPATITLGPLSGGDSEAIQAAASEADALEQEGTSLQEQGNQLMQQSLTAQDAALQRYNDQLNRVREYKRKYSREGWKEPLPLESNKILDQVEPIRTKQEITPEDKNKRHISVTGAFTFPLGKKVKILINDHPFLVIFNAEKDDNGEYTHEFFEVLKDLHPPSLFTKPTLVYDGRGYVQVPGIRTDVQPLEFQAGSTVTLQDDFTIDYMFNIIPSHVTAVLAYRSVNNIRQLVALPDNYYKITEHDYGTIRAQVVALKRPLSCYGGGLSPKQNWEDGIYVSQVSSVGPNFCDIVYYLIDQYTVLRLDANSFKNTRRAVDNYPCNFVLTEKKNILSLLNDMAFQSRCAVWVDGLVVFMKYLPLEEDSVDIITDDDVIQGTVSIECTPTEEIVTKLTGTWKPSYELAQPNKMIVRFNIAKYGLVEQSYDFYTLTDAVLVQKSLTFWLIRKSNSWKLVKFSCFLNKLHLEPFDTVTLSFVENYVAKSAVKGMITSAQYNSATQTINFEVWVPVRFGEMTPYIHAWPANIPPSLIYPTREEVFSGTDTNDPKQLAFGNIPTVVGQDQTGGGTQVSGWDEEINTGFESQRSVTRSIEKQPLAANINAFDLDTKASVFGSSLFSDRGDHYPSDLGDLFPTKSSQFAHQIIEKDRPELEPYKDTTSAAIHPFTGQGSTGDTSTGKTVFLGKVVSGKEKSYKVDLYADGTSKTKTGTVTVTIPQLAKGEIIPVGTILQAVHKINNKGVITYECQPPVWL